MNKISPPCLSNLSVVILAGGQGKRVAHRQKALLSYQGKPLLTGMLQRLMPQGAPIWLNVNTNLPDYNAYDLPLFSDTYQGFLGPLAGMHAAWRWLETDWIVFVPCDNPNVPQDLIERLMLTCHTHPAPLVVVDDGQRMQPLYLLMHRSMAPILKQALDNSHLSVFKWIKENEHTLADFSGEGTQAFQNINTLETL